MLKQVDKLTKEAKIVIEKEINLQKPSVNMLSMMYNTSGGGGGGNDDFKMQTS